MTNQKIVFRSRGDLSGPIRGHYIPAPSSRSLKLEKETLLPSMLHSPPQPVMPSSQFMSIPRVTNQKPVYTDQSEAMTYLRLPRVILTTPCCHRSQPSETRSRRHCRSQNQTRCRPAPPRRWPCCCSGCGPAGTSCWCLSRTLNISHVEMLTLVCADRDVNLNLRT